MAEVSLADIPEDDPILPTQIEHCLDEVRIEGSLVCRYNFLDYHFESDQGHYIRARVYLHTPAEATVFGPFISKQLVEMIDDSAFLQMVNEYMKRRFKIVLSLEELVSSLPHDDDC